MNRRPKSLLAGNMIGDALGTYGHGTLTATSTALGEDLTATFDLPLSGRVPKIAENNSPVPQDRVYFAYNFFRSAYGFETNSTPLAPFDPEDPTTFPRDRSGNLNVNRFTVGIEKTFFFEDMSLELRVPMVTTDAFSTPAATDPTATAFRAGTQDVIGKLALNFKQVLFDWYGDRSSGVLTWGAGFAFPTARGGEVDVYDARFNISDSAIHFSPYLAFLTTGESGWFFQGFFQFDIANTRLKVRDGTGTEVGRYHLPNLAHIDLGLGYWLYHNQHRRMLLGVAPVFEFHYTGQMQTFEPVAFNLSSPSTVSMVQLNHLDRRRDLFNVTGGFHVAMTKWMNVRAAAVLPLRDDPDRDFDAEFVFQMDLVR